MVANIAVGIRMTIAPLSGSLAEKRDVEDVRFAGIYGRRLGFGDGRRNEGVLDGVGVDAVVDLGEGALEVPIELEPVVFVILEALKFRDEVELEFRAKPRAKLERDVFVGKSAAIAARTRNQPPGAG